MNPFAFTRATDADAALRGLVASRNAQFIAGGTNILDLMKDAVVEPPLLIDINALPLRAIQRRGDRLFLGALARMSDIAADEDVRAQFPMVATALEESASPQLRNMASIGGNILQRTRCAYFRDLATPCNKRVPGSGCGAIGGVTYNLAVLGTSEHCIATHASDVAVPFMALDAIVHVRDLHSEREIAFSQFYRTPGTTPARETTLADGEMIVGISLPLDRSAAKSMYLKVRDRAQYEFALASAAVALDTSGASIVRARIALGGVGTIPWRVPQAEQHLAGKVPGRAVFSEAAELALTGARAYGENEFKIPLAKRTLIRALEMASEGV